ncbi:glucosyl/glucuronosyl transferase [Penaeus vannamei]|uniref:Glucosyl/glucuronosyl transferase n=1 Tax=Penaeus vannamei TaxID=6689 RepID=A0A423THE4_PENVA|nr:glucosyl/glucuronosyl transferase [Penaeus vannamei]
MALILTQGLDLAKFVEESGDAGVIYFSLGSIGRSSDMPKKYKDILVEAFRSLPQRIVWKYEGHDLELPPNVLTRPWLPQQDILGHPKTRLFISHCGNLGTQEAKYHGVPILGVPLTFDQHRNAARLARKGCGTVLNWEDLSLTSIVDKVDMLLKDDSYRACMRAISGALRDQKESPGERAVRWVEYLIRHRNSTLLKYPGERLHYLQYAMVDVWAVWAAVLVLWVWAAWTCVRPVNRWPVSASTLHLSRLTDGPVSASTLHLSRLTDGPIARECINITFSRLTDGPVSASTLDFSRLTDGRLTDGPVSASHYIQPVTEPRECINITSQPVNSGPPVTDGPVSASTLHLSRLTDGPMSASTLHFSRLTDGPPVNRWPVSASTLHLSRLTDGPVSASTLHFSRLTDGPVSASTLHFSRLTDGLRLTDGPVSASTLHFSRLTDGPVSASTLHFSRLTDGPPVNRWPVSASTLHLSRLQTCECINITMARECNQHYIQPVNNPVSAAGSPWPCECINITSQPVKDGPRECINITSQPVNRWPRECINITFQPVNRWPRECINITSQPVNR